MLRAWLDETSERSFHAHRRAGKAYAQPDVRAIRSAWFDWRVLASVLASRDVLVTRDGALFDAAVPTSPGELRAAMARGLGIVVRHAEQGHRVLRGLARAFEREFATQAHVQLFVTPGGTRGFAWHYDHEDVVILQTGGRKSYYLRENTCVGQALPERPDFRCFQRETSPLGVCTLCAGDALYLPRGTWHMGKAEQDSLSISIGLEFTGRPWR